MCVFYSTFYSVPKVSERFLIYIYGIHPGECIYMQLTVEYTTLSSVGDVKRSLFENKYEVTEESVAFSRKLASMG